MIAKSSGTQMPWADPDDAPELTEEFFSKATPMIGGQPVSREQFVANVKKRMGRPLVEVTRPTLNMRVDPDVLAALKASGKGWQTRLNALLRREVLGERA
ncbi:MAG: hypothetical protein EOO81_02785 [Oxalobacteraceae bacterium]|nr:MAG: hypothetical protein EOO81_02785 [Oxalobacteraceae bacterium]